MSDVPNDVLREILIRVPAESVLTSRAVCKAWKLTIDDPSFLHFHSTNLQHCSHPTILIRESKGGGITFLSLDRLNPIDSLQQIDLHPFKQLIHHGLPRLLQPPAASCHGLILISHRRNWRNWAIWNPLTQTLHELPQPDADLQSVSGRSASVGFGYDPAAEDYKVVRIDKLHQGGVITYDRTLVYSMKLRNWRRIGDFPYVIASAGNGVFLNGALHWQSRDGIAALDLGTEQFSLLPRPHLMSPSPARYTSELLDALNGYLFLSYYHEQGQGLDVWLMIDYRVGDSWIKLCSIDIVSGFTGGGGLRPVAYLRSRKQVFLEHCRGGLFWLDLEKDTVKEVSIEGHRSVSFSQFSPAGSLLRLDNTDSVVVEKKSVGMKRKRDGDCGTGRLRLKFHVRDTGGETYLTSF
ncbi:F-box protein CPR1-like isoform X2 [Salvia miltiorrhiza]|uniref:F-box protein CPR1-like isoform X1 n=1 Tax=Salvia miltiorrhiza TaxID=226208 RepID=UPI0025ACC3AE|nr:F-box protein CPR1-like isoform X1 [Salvia miltiorrhiza]XP_057767883.1 F-box protein CPR1-like isoform X2 [Salvia miltiorrhiza]